jgi:NAD(P)H-dependent FMN reductase
MKKIIVISTSLRTGSNSDMLADQFIEGAEAAGHEVEKIYPESHPACGPTSGSEAYLKSDSASDSCQWRSKILSVSIRLYQCFAVYLLCVLTQASR